MKRRITRTTILLMISLLFVMLPLSSCGGSKKVSLEKYAEIVFREPTYNGYATPRLEVDTDTLDASVPEETMRKFHKKVSLALLGSGNKLSDLIYFDFAEDYKNLKNGDTIEVVVKPEADLELCGITTLEKNSVSASVLKNGVSRSRDSRIRQHKLLICKRSSVSTSASITAMPHHRFLWTEMHSLN